MKLSLSRELLIFCIAIIASVALLPGLIYVVGGRLFGAYGAAAGMVGMYRAMLTDLVVPTLAAWIIALCPALCVVLLRLLFGLTRDHSTEPKQIPAVTRREPTISG